MNIFNKNKYDELIEAAFLDFKVYSENPDEYKIKKLTLESKNIGSLLQKIIQNCSGIIDQASSIVGRYLSQVVQNSYDAGNNDFKLNVGDSQIDLLGEGLVGKDSLKRVKISIKGNVGYGCGRKSKNIKITIKGNVGTECGSYTNWCDFVVKGDVDNELGKESKYSKFNIDGNAGDYCGANSTNSFFVIKKDVGENCGNSSFRSSFHIDKCSGKFCGYLVEESNFYVGGSIGSWGGFGSKRSGFFIGEVGNYFGAKSIQSVFNVADRESYKKIINHGGPGMIRCTLQLRDEKRGLKKGEVVEKRYLGRQF